MTVITDDMVADIADAYLSLSPDTFEAWLRERARKQLWVTGDTQSRRRTRGWHK